MEHLQSNALLDLTLTLNQALMDAWLMRMDRRILPSKPLVGVIDDCSGPGLAACLPSPAWTVDIYQVLAENDEALET